jgi:hypothetical protein
VTEHVHVSDLRWDRLLAGELSDDAAAALRADAQGCVVCETRLAQLTRESELFAQRPALAAPRRRRLWWIVAAPIGMAAAAAVLLLARTEPPPTGERIKGTGDAQLVVLAGQPGAMRMVENGDHVRGGEYLQVGYSAQRDGFGAVLSRDGAGATNVYVQAAPSVMVALAAGRDQAFPGSTLLDDTRGFEVIVALWCERALGLPPLVQELATTGDVVTPAGCTKRRVTFTKDPR